MLSTQNDIYAVHNAILTCLKMSMLLALSDDRIHKLVFGCSAIDCLEGLVSKMTYYVASGTLNPTHSLTHSLTHVM